MTYLGSEEAGISAAHRRELTRALSADSDDAVLLVWAPEEDAGTAAREILIRARETLEGIPAETRQAFADGTNGFERILPGPDRMYPDTDTPPLPIPDSMVAEVRSQLGEPPWDRRARYRSLGLSERAAKDLAVAPWADLFDEISPKEGEPARRLSAVLEKRIPFHGRRRGGSKPRTTREIPAPSTIAPLVRAFEEGQIRKEALGWAIDDVLADPALDVQQVLEKYLPRADDEEKLERTLLAVVGEIESRRETSPEVAVRWAMGEVMRRFFGRVDPSEVRKRLTDLVTSQPEGVRSGAEQWAGDGELSEDPVTPGGPGPRGEVLP
jgi:glutamyl-tRNA(Gln) amidotransferase subunit E